MPQFSAAALLAFAALRQFSRQTPVFASSWALLDAGRAEAFFSAARLPLLCDACRQRLLLICRHYYFTLIEPLYVIFSFHYAFHFV